MSDTTRLETIATALGELVDRYGHEGVDDSLRRIAMAIARDRELSRSVREIAAQVLDAKPGEMEDSARELFVLLRLAIEESEPKLRHAIVVEPDVVTADAIRIHLESEGWRVTRLGAADGVLERMHSDPAELVVVDIFLPDRDGRDLILDLAQSPALRDAPIVALAPDSQREALTKSECIALGATRFMHRKQAAVGLTEFLQEGGTVDGPSETPAESGFVGILQRAKFGVRYATRDSSAGGGSIALVHLQGLRDIAETHGPDQADQAATEIANMLAAEVPGIMAFGRWATLQLVALMPNLDASTAADHIRGAALLVASHPWITRAEDIVGQMTITVVDAPRGSSLDERVAVAGKLRVGLGREGALIRTSGNNDPSAPPTIGVVEDDPVTQALVVHKLRHAGFEVTPFNDGNRASAVFSKDLFDLYLLDINLPGKDGFELIRELRGNERARTRPILVLSSMGSDADVVRGLDLGADDYMLKPFSPVELTARVRRLLSGISS